MVASYIIIMLYTTVEIPIKNYKQLYFTLLISWNNNLTPLVFDVTGECWEKWKRCNRVCSHAAAVVPFLIQV